MNMNALSLLTIQEYPGLKALKLEGEIHGCYC